MTATSINPQPFETIGRRVTIPNASLDTILEWADVIVEDEHGGDRILLSGIKQSEGDSALRVGAAYLPHSDSTVGDTFTEVTVPSDCRVVGVGDRFHFSFINSRANRPGEVYFPKIGSLAICWQRPSS
jgi:hypothetical protein